METAIIFNQKSGFSKTMTAVEYERLYHGNKRLGINPIYPLEEPDLVAVSRKDGMPLRLRGSYKKIGNDEIVKACWVRPDGFGDNDHVFGQIQQESLARALKDGKVVLLSLNLELTPHTISFENMQERNTKNLQDWLGEKRGKYLSIPIHSAKEALSAIKNVHAQNGKMPIDQRIFALHGGTVVPYRNFYLGHRGNFFSALYNKMQQHASGIPIGETRMLGFPRLFRFVPTKSTLSEHGTRGLKGNHVNLKNSKPLFSSLIFTHHDDALATDPYKILTQEIITQKEGVYILASPTVTVTDPANGSSNEWPMIRWIIHDIETQTAPLDEKAKQLLQRGNNSNQIDSHLEAIP